MVTQDTMRFLAALGILTATIVLAQEIQGGKIGILIALGFAFWYIVRHDLEGILVRPLTWASGLLNGR